MKLTALMALLLLGSGASAHAPSRKRSLPELLAAMKASPTAFKIQPLSEAQDIDTSDLIDVVYPLDVKPVELPQVKVVGGKRVVVAAPCDAASPKLKEAERLLHEQRYTEAGALCQSAVALAPNCYAAYAHRGDTEFHQGRIAEALADYDKALALNPDDGSIYVSRAFVLQRMHRISEYVDALRWSLALRPRDPTVLEILRASQGFAHITVRDVDVSLHGFARMEGSAVAVYSDGEAWLGYAACKGLWLADPAHRKAAPGTARHAFTLQEEQECVAALLGAYEKSKRSPKFVDDPQLSQLEEISRAGWAPEWIVYELASRVDPQVVLTLPKRERRRVFEFVKRYVAVNDADAKR